MKTLLSFSDNNLYAIEDWDSQDITCDVHCIHSSNKAADTECCAHVIQTRIQPNPKEITNNSARIEKMLRNTISIERPDRKYQR